MEGHVQMIRSFKHKGLENFFLKGQVQGVRPDHVKKLRQVLGVLNAATSIQDIKSIPALGYHPLSGQRKNEHSVWVNKNWRITFEFEHGDVYLTNYEDYHGK